MNQEKFIELMSDSHSLLKKFKKNRKELDDFILSTFEKQGIKINHITMYSNGFVCTGEKQFSFEAIRNIMEIFSDFELIISYNELNFSYDFTLKSEEYSKSV